MTMKNSKIRMLISPFKLGLATVALCLVANVTPLQAQYQVTTLGAAVVENFNGMQVPTGTITAVNFNAALGGTTQGQRNAAWVLTSLVGRGNDNGGGSPGGGWTAYANVNSSTDKALGMLGNSGAAYNGTNIANSTATFANASGSTVTSFVLSYSGEQWRANSGLGSITVQYSVNGGTFTDLSTSTFNLNIVNATNIANTTTLAGALNGDASGNRTTALGATVTGLSLANGQNIQFRFLFSVGTNSKAVAIDDVSVTFNGAPASGNFWVGDDSVLGGSGTWTASGGSSWRTTNTDGTGAAFDAAQPANFGGTSAGTVTVSGTVAPQEGINFNTTGYTVTEGTINLAGSASANNTISTGSGVTATINSELTGTTGMTKSGAGNLTLGGTNSYSGGTTISAGTLALVGSGSLNATATVSNSGTFDIAGLSGSSTTIGSIGGSGAIVLGSKELITGGEGTDTNVSGVISGTGGALTKNGAGNMTLSGSGANTFTGVTTVNAGNLTLSKTAGTNAIAGNLSVSGGTVRFGANNQIADGSAVSMSSGSIEMAAITETVGSFAITGGALNGSGTLTASTYALNGGTIAANLGVGTATASSGTTNLNGTLGGTLNVSGGTVVLGSSNRIADGSSVSISSGALNLGANSDTIGSFVITGGALNGSGTLTAATYALSGGSVNASLGAGAATASAGSTTLNGTLSGSLAVSGGTVTLGAAERIANSSTVSVSSGTLNLSGFTETTGALTTTGGEISNGTLNAASYALGGGTISANLTGSGAMSVTAGSNTLSGNNSGYNGAVAISGGTINASSNDALGGGAVTMTGGQILGGDSVIVSNSITIGSVSSNTSVSENFNSIASGVPSGWTLRTGSTNSTLGTNVTGSAYTSTATSWGSASTAGFYNVAAAAVGASANATTQNAYSDRAMGLRPAGGAPYDPGAAIVYSTTTSGSELTQISLDLMMLDVQGRSSTYSVQYSTNNGTSWTTFTGGTWADPATFGTTSFTFNSTTDMTALGNQTSVLLRVATLSAASGTGSRDLIGLDNFSLIRTAGPAGTGTLGIAGAGNTTFTGAILVNNTASLTAGLGGLASFNGTISGNGSVTKTGAGVVALNTANTLTGNVIATGGTLRLGAANALGNVTSVTVNSTATLEIATSGTVRDAAAVTLNGGTIARAAGVSETFGALTLGANSTIDFGSGATGTIAFQPGSAGGFTPGAFTLSVVNFSQGNVLSFGSSTQLFAVGTYVNGFSGSGFDFGTQAFTASFASNTFTITAIPEPTVILPILAFIGLFLWGERKRLPNQIRKRLRKLGLARG